RLGEDQIVRRAAMAIGVMQIGHGKPIDFAGAIDSTRRDHHLAGLASMGAAVHAKRTTDATWDAAIEREAEDAGVARGAGNLRGGYGRPGAAPRPLLDLECAEALPQTDHHAANTAVAHEQIGAKSDD